MSAAAHVTNIGPNMEWLDIEDDAGRIWRYRRGGALDLAEPAEVEGHFTRGQPTRAVLVRDADGHVLLQGDGDRLPRTTVVEHVDDPTDPMLSILGLSPKEEYELVT